MSIAEAFASIGAGGVWGVMSRCFEFMGIAEDVVAEKKRQYPDKADNIHWAWSLCMATPQLRDKGLELYRCHCEEIVQRHIDGGDTTQPTRAEVIAALADASLAAPLTQAANYLYLTMATEEMSRFPGFRKNVAPMTDTAEAIKVTHGELFLADATSEVLRKTSSKLVVPDRIYKPKLDDDRA